MSHASRTVRRSDVLVVGGGVIGLVTAWRAAQRGLSRHGGRPRARAAAPPRSRPGCWPPSPSCTTARRRCCGLNLASARRYPAFVAELTEATGQRPRLPHLRHPRRRARRRRPGPAARTARLPAAARAGRRSGSPAASAAGWSRCSPRACAAGCWSTATTRSTRGGWPRRWSTALRAGRGACCHRAGPSGCSVVGRPGHRGRRLADGTAAGAPGRWCSPAGSLSGRLAGRARRRCCRRCARSRARSCGCACPRRYAPFLSRTVRAVVRGSHVYLVPREDGELVVGATSEEQGFDTTVTAGGVYELLRDAHELVPGITELPLVETRAGLRPGSPDNAPLLGPTALPGLLLATGHYRNGVLLTPVTGDAAGRRPGHRRPPGRRPAPSPPARFPPAGHAPPRAARMNDPRTVRSPSTASPARSPPRPRSPTLVADADRRRPPAWPSRSTRPSCRAAPWAATALCRGRPGRGPHRRPGRLTHGRRPASSIGGTDLRAPG